MPLIHGSSRQAISTNIKREQEEDVPHKQAIAIALDVARRAKRAMGGFTVPNMTPSWQMRQEARGMHTGPILSAVPGRTDHHHIAVPSGAYVLPADHVSALGDGNTHAGMAVVNRMFGNAGPYGVGKNMPIVHGRGAPPPPRPAKFAKGGAAGTEGKPVEIMAAGGEIVLTPEQVRAVAMHHFGVPDINAGHKLLDAWVLHTRQQHVKTLKRLPPPAKG